MVSPAPRALRTRQPGKSHLWPMSRSWGNKTAAAGSGEGAQRPASPAGGFWVPCPVNPSRLQPAQVLLSPQSPLRGVYSCPGTKRRLAEHGQVRLIPNPSPASWKKSLDPKGPLAPLLSLSPPCLLCLLPHPQPAANPANPWPVPLNQKCALEAAALKALQAEGNLP